MKFFDYVKNEMLSGMENLLKSGEDVYQVDRYKLNAMDYACKKQNLEMIQLLYDYGYDLEHKNYSGETTLYRVAINNKTKSLKYLIDLGANIHVYCSYGWPLIARCFQIGSYLTAKILYENGADVRENFRTGHDPNSNIFRMLMETRNIKGILALLKIIGKLSFHRELIEMLFIVDNFWRNALDIYNHLK